MGLFNQIISFLIKTLELKKSKQSTSKNKISEVRKPSPPNYYQSAKEGTFNSSYFLNLTTSLFKFPNYNKDNKKHAVEIKDVTNYKEIYFDGYTKAERDSYTFKDFEFLFSAPELEVENFEDFLDHLDAADFNSQLGKAISINLINDFSESLEVELDESETFEMYLRVDMANKLEKLGYVTISIDQYSQEGYLRTLSIINLTNLCVSNNLIPYKTKNALVKQLTKVNIIIPIIVVNATEKLSNYYAMFPQLYIKALKKNADRFHPLYIATVFEYALESNENTQVINLLDIEIKSEYWKTRLEEKIY